MNADKLRSLMINDEGFAFDPRSGNTYSINATGLLVINCIKAGATSEQIKEQLSGQFEVDEKTTDRDLEAFYNELERLRLTEAEVAS